MPKKSKIWLLSKEQVQELYKTHTLKELAKLFDCTHPTVINCMRKRGVERRDHDEKFIHGHNYSREWYATQERAKQRGEDHPAYKGGTYIDADGYRRIYNHDTQKYEREHRKIAESMLGRKLTGGEDVHHKDKNKLNNDPENLEVLSKDLHHELHEPEMEEKYG